MLVLDNRKVKSLPGPDGDKRACIHWDGLLKGFGVRVLASGKRSWIVRYRVRGGGVERFVTLGDINLVKADEAREEARTHLLAARTGQDHTQTHQSPTGRRFGDLVNDYVADARRCHKRPGEAVRYVQEMAGPLHDKLVREIARADIADAIKTVRERHGDVSANRFRSRLSACFNLAIANGKSESNPVQGTRRFAERSRERVLSQDELKALWAATQTGTIYSRIIRLLLLTGCRRSEVAEMELAELEGNVWVIPAARSKNGCSHRVVLPPLAMAQFSAFEAGHGGRRYVFGAADGPFSAFSVSKERLDRRLKFRKPWTLHDLRRTFATGLAELEVAPHVIEACLNHKLAGVAAIYNRAKYEKEKAAALVAWSEYVAGMMNA